MLSHLRNIGKKQQYDISGVSQMSYSRHYDSAQSLEGSSEITVWCCFRTSRSKKKSTDSPRTETYTKTTDIRTNDADDTIPQTDEKPSYKSLQEELESCKSDLTICKQEKDDISSRFSELAGRQLTENNPHITNLNDPNRPQKLADMFSEIYDNEWTETFIALQTAENETKDRTNTFVLLDLLKRSLKGMTVENHLWNVDFIYWRDWDVTSKKGVTIGTIAYDGSMSYLNKFAKYVQEWFGENKECPDSRLFDFAVSTAETMLPCLQTEVINTIVKTYDEKNVTACNLYIQRCITVCFYMAVKSPKMFLQFDCTPDKIDKTCFKPFTKDGDTLDYVVWPALFLYKDGPLMSKGVVQCV